MVMVIATVMVIVMVMATVTVMVMALQTLGKVSETVGEVVDVGAEQVSFSSFSSSAAPRCSWVTVKLRATTFFRLDVFLATLEIMPLHWRGPLHVLCNNVDDVDDDHDDRHGDDVDYNDDVGDLQHGSLCDG